MGHIGLRIDDNLKTAFKQACDKMGISMTHYLTGQVRELVQNGEEHIDDNVWFKAMQQSIKDDAQEYQKAFHVANNLHEELEIQLVEKRYPMHPEEVEMEWYSRYWEVLDACDRPDRIMIRKKMQMNNTFASYCTLHPSDVEYDIDVTDAAVTFLGRVAIEDDQEAAFAQLNDLISSGLVPDRRRDSIKDEIRNLSKKQWRNEWKRAVWQGDGPNVESEETLSEPARMSVL